MDISFFARFIAIINVAEVKMPNVEARMFI